MIYKITKAILLCAFALSILGCRSDRLTNKPTTTDVGKITEIKEHKTPIDINSLAPHKYIWNVETERSAVSIWSTSAGRPNGFVVGATASIIEYPSGGKYLKVKGVELMEKIFLKYYVDKKL